MAADDAAVVVRLQANLKDYESALKSAVRATERAATNAEKVLSNIGRKAPAGTAIAQNFQKSAGAIANDARQLQFQLNDIFSGVASGQGIRAVQQQLGQIAQQLSGGGLAAGARTFASALVGMVNPINLAVVAFGILASVAASYFSDAEKDAAKATKELKSQADALDDLAKKYGALFPELNRAAENLRKQADAAGLNEAKQKALAEAYKDSAKTIADTSIEVSNLIAVLEAMHAPMEDLRGLQNEFNKLKKAVDDQNASSKDAAKLLQALNGIIENGHGRVVDLAKAIRDDLVKSFGELDRAAKSAGETIQRSLDFQMPGAGGPLDLGPLVDARIHAASREPGTAKEFLKTRAASQEIADSLDRLDDEFAQALARLFAHLPSTARITSGVRTFEEQARARARFEAGTGGLAARPGHSRHEEGTFREGGSAVDISQGVSMEELRAAVKLVPELEQLDAVSEKTYQRDKVHVQLRGEAIKQEKELAEQRVKNEEAAAKTAEQQQKNIEDWKVAAEDRISLTKQISEINGQFWLSESQRAAQVEALRIAEERLAELRREGIPITAAMEQQVRSLAEAQANATLKSSEAAEAAKKTLKDQQESTQLAQQMNQQFAGIIGGALSGFVNDLINGEDAGDAFNNMLKRMAGQLADMVIQMLIIKPLMNSLFGGGGATIGMGGIGSFFSKGGVVGRDGEPGPVDPRWWRNAPSFARGGTVGLPSGAVPIIAHRGERIIPKGAGIGGDVHNDIGDINIDMSGTGLVATSTQSGKLLGRELQAAVQVVLVKESRPGGILRRPT